MTYAIYNRDTGALLDLSEAIQDVLLPVVCQQITAPDLSRETWAPTLRVFVPKLVRRITKQQFIDRLAPEEFTGILAAAKIDANAEAWLFRFNNLTPDPDGTSIDLDDPRTSAGLAAMFGASRAAEILG